MAAFTREMIDALWPDHPPVFLCGIPMPPDEEAFLPSTADPRDWAGGVHCATQALLERGFEQAYVILDDHPPFGYCHVQHLNETLPRLASELSAACISLLGWGQGQQPVKGEVLGDDQFRLLRMAEDFPWRFSLHPGLWSLPVLDGLCEWRASDDQLSLRSAWAFERHCGDASAPLPDEWKRGAYRVSGERMISPLCQVRFSRVRAERLLCHAVRHALSSLGRCATLMAFDKSTRHLFRYYEGPYPLLHSGVLVKGAPSPCAIRFSRRHGPRLFRSRLQRLLSETGQREAACI
jgi:hypothetical protein